MAQTLVCCSARYLPTRGGRLGHTVSTNWRRLSNVRALTPTSTRAKSDEKTDEVKDEPIKFSTSKASHRTWKVNRAMGSQYQRPWQRVLPISIIGISFLLWCAFRKQTDIDAILEKTLYDHLPGLVRDQEEENPEER